MSRRIFLILYCLFEICESHPNLMPVLEMGVEWADLLNDAPCLSEEKGGPVFVRKSNGKKLKSEKKEKKTWNLFMSMMPHIAGRKKKSPSASTSPRQSQEEEQSRDCCPIEAAKAKAAIEELKNDQAFQDKGMGITYAISAWVTAVDYLSKHDIKELDSLIDRLISRREEDILTQYNTLKRVENYAAVVGTLFKKQRYDLIVRMREELAGEIRRTKGTGEVNETAMEVERKFRGLLADLAPFLADVVISDTNFDDKKRAKYLINYALEGLFEILCTAEPLPTLMRQTSARSTSTERAWSLLEFLECATDASALSRSLSNSSISVISSLSDSDPSDKMDRDKARACVKRIMEKIPPHDLLLESDSGFINLFIQLEAPKQGGPSEEKHPSVDTSSREESPGGCMAFKKGTELEPFVFEFQNACECADDDFVWCIETEGRSKERPFFIHRDLSYLFITELSDADRDALQNLDEGGSASYGRLEESFPGDTGWCMGMGARYVW